MSYPNRRDVIEETRVPASVVISALATSTGRTATPGKCLPVSIFEPVEASEPAPKVREIRQILDWPAAGV
jgi:hypothetical protein